MGVLRDITDEKMTRELAVSQSALALALSNTVAVLTSTLDINEVFDRILTNLELVVPHQAANIMLIENDLACIVRHRGYVERGWTGVLQVACLPWKEMPLLKRMVETGAPVFVPDTHLETDWKAHEAYQELRAYAATPIQIKGEVIGFLNLDSDQPGYFKDGDAERLAVFADQAAIAIENARLYSEVQRLAVCDDLTGMFNRRGLFEFGGRETERSLKDGTPLSVAWLDFDFFKKVNDSFGHEAGDIVLQQVARLCRRSLRSVDLVGRYGGDELVVILPNTDLPTAQKVCERLRGIISSSAFLVGDGEVHLTVSIGLAALNPDKPELNDVMNRADHAMYSAKAAGRDCVVLDAEVQP
jgi:diguanylate cyclase (GGDEF)-like protein